MKAEAAAAIFNNPIRPLPSNLYSSPISRQIKFPYQRCLLGRYNSVKGLQLYSNGSLQYTGGVVCAVNGGGRGYVSSWDDKPYEYLPTGRKSYLDEQDIVTFLDPPKDLIPLDSASYNPAAYLWKKIDDIPPERRHRLLRLLEPRLISRAWEIAGTRYEDPNLAKRSASKLLSNEDGAISLEYYNCRTNGGGSFVTGLANSFSPLYFVVRQHKEVMPTEQPCDLAYEFGDGLFDLHEYPEGFPKPVKHPYPFNDQVVVYVRHLGPGVSVGQAWQEGKELQQVPQKLCSEILMVKDYSALRENQ
ncbi:hypothetical protein ACE6H2_011250 [Prunus campanulata]